jgi:hypothetical protein
MAGNLGLTEGMSVCQDGLCGISRNNMVARRSLCLVCFDGGNE